MSALATNGVSLRYGGVQALNDVTIEVQEQVIHAIIGPNGAGKTTWLNVCSGLARPTSGTVEVNGRQLQGRRASTVARAGLARTFQNIQLFSEATVLDNALVGAEAQAPIGLARAILRTGKARQITRNARRRAHECLELVNLSDESHQRAGALPYGKQRLLEIARALASSPTVLLLDEPGAGFNRNEKQQLGSILKTIKDSGVSVVIVEHDMPLVMAIADTISVLDFGNKIAEGSPAEVANDPEVIDAYLGLGDEDAEGDEAVSDPATR